MTDNPVTGDYMAGGGSGWRLAWRMARREIRGSVARFINHSCKDPNASLKKLLDPDTGVLRIVVVAARTVQKDEFVTMKYSSKACLACTAHITSAP